MTKNAAEFVKTEDNAVQTVRIVPIVLPDGRLIEFMEKEGKYVKEDIFKSINDKNSEKNNNSFKKEMKDLRNFSLPTKTDNLHSVESSQDVKVPNIYSND